MNQPTLTYIGIESSQLVELDRLLRIPAGDHEKAVKNEPIDDSSRRILIVRKLLGFDNSAANAVDISQGGNQ